VVDLHEFDRCPADLDEGDRHAADGAVRLDDDAMAREGDREVVASNVKCGIVLTRSG
jgi:hypothetical protein